MEDSVTFKSNQKVISVNYYSCDGKTGYFHWNNLFYTEYILKNVPLSIWNEFSKSESKGSYFYDKILNDFDVMSVKNY
jgi:KTSC domain